MKKKSGILIGLNYVMALTFIFAMIAQYNDPDTFRWMTMYGVAALACILWLKGRIRKIVPAGIGAIAIIWAAFLMPDVIGQGTFGREMFGSFKMNNISVEEAREMGGLLIVAVWMLVLAIFSPDKSVASITGIDEK